MDRKIYKESEVETQPLKRKVMVHGAMNYECEVCGKVFLMWLEKGLEDKVSDDKNGGHKPVPYTIPCLCGGIAKHVRWNEDVHLDEYTELQENMDYFSNDDDWDCGMPHIRTEGKEYCMERLKEPQKAFMRGCTEEDNDDPYGLACFSTSQLKAELRRRKRW